MKKRIVVWMTLLVFLTAMLTGCSSIVQKAMDQRREAAGDSEGRNTASDKAAAEPKEDLDYYTVYVQADLSWGIPYLWAWSDEEGDLYEQWPGEKMTFDMDGWYYLEIPTIYDNVVVNGQNGGVQTEDEITYGQDIWFVVNEKEYSVDFVKPTEPTTPSDGYIAQLDGEWEEVSMNTGSSNIQTWAKVYSQTVYNCREMTIELDLTMNAGTNCKDWHIWGRTGGTFTQIGKLHHEAGDGPGTFVITFDTPVTFDAIALTPTIPGGYSWSLGFVLTDIWTTP